MDLWVESTAVNLTFLRNYHPCLSHDNCSGPFEMGWDMSHHIGVRGQGGIGKEVDNNVNFIISTFLSFGNTEVRSEVEN